MYQQQFEKARLQALESAKGTTEIWFRLDVKCLMAMTFPNYKTVKGSFVEIQEVATELRDAKHIQHPSAEVTNSVTDHGKLNV
jgi:hypothetical protein